MHQPVGALRAPELCFCPAKLEKKLNFLRCIHVFDLLLNYGSDITAANWIQVLFYFIVLMGIVVSGNGMSFCQLCSRF